MEDRKNNLFKVKRREEGFKRGLGEIDLSAFIIRWSSLNPVDRLWREKYKIPFNSEQHRKIKIIDMLVDLGQDTLFNTLVKIHNEKSVKYHPNRGEYFKLNSKGKILSQKEIEEVFDSIDIGSIQTDEEGNIIL